MHRYFLFALIGTAGLAFFTLSRSCCVTPAFTQSVRIHANDDLVLVKDLFRRPIKRHVAHGRAGNLSQVVALGQRLFSDRRLSRGRDMSCASCHVPAYDFTDRLPQARGRKGIVLKRNTPTLWDVGHVPSLFWDGRVRSLEDQARVPIEHADEMNFTLAEAARRLNGDQLYRRYFAAAFPGSVNVTSKAILTALAVYQRSLSSPKSRLDDWVRGDDKALTSKEVRGFRLFVGKAGCIACHGGWRFTDNRFHDIGLESDDPGREAVSGRPSDRNAFKTPSLRQLTKTAPYMHNGSIKTLEGVLEHYEHGMIRRQTLSPELRRRISLTREERAAIVAFLKTLTGKQKPRT